MPKPRAWAFLRAAAGMLAAVTVAWAVDEYGPRSRVVFRPYLPDFGEMAYILVAAGLGFWVFLGMGRPLGRTRLALACAFLAWAVVRQLDAFPSHGSLAERDAWARAHVREYPGLARLASQLPVVLADLQNVVAVAPTGAEPQVYARDMDGDAMRFTLDVVGERSRGVLWVDATFSEGNVWAWRGGRWTFGGVTRPVEGVREPHP